MFTTALIDTINIICEVTINIEEQTEKVTAHEYVDTLLNDFAHVGDIYLLMNLYVVRQHIMGYILVLADLLKPLLVVKTDNFHEVARINDTQAAFKSDQFCNVKDSTVFEPDKYLERYQRN